MAPLSITDLLTKIGVDRIQVQNLHESIVQVQASKGGTRVTFMTDPNCCSPNELALDRPRHTALVLWIKQEDVDRVLTGEAEGKAGK